VVTLRTSQPSLSISTETMALCGDFHVSMSLASLRSFSSSSLRAYPVITDNHYR